MVVVFYYIWGDFAIWEILFVILLKKEIRFSVVVLENCGQDGVRYTQSWFLVIDDSRDDDVHTADSRGLRHRPTR